MVVAVVALVVLFSIGAFAGNQYEHFAFSANSQKQDSDSNFKASDGDMLAYVTTLSSYNGSSSNVFPNGGTFYARSRMEADTEIQSGLFTFTSNMAKTTSYGSDVVFGTDYILRAEIENTRFTGAAMYQWVRWCP